MELLDLLWEFIWARMTEEQYQESKLLFEDCDRLILYLCYSYNVCETLYSQGAMQLITNPNDLFISKKEIVAFIDEYKCFVYKVLNEEMTNAASENNRANQKNS